LGLGNAAEQIAYQIVEFDVVDKVGGLLAAQRSAEHAREAE